MYVMFMYDIKKLITFKNLTSRCRINKSNIPFKRGKIKKNKSNKN